MDTDFGNMRHMGFIKPRIHTPLGLGLVSAQLKGKLATQRKGDTNRGAITRLGRPALRKKSTHFWDHWFHALS